MLFVLITLGIAMIILAMIENVQNRFTRWMTIYGRVPFFYYIMHLYLVHALCVIAFFLSGYGTDKIVSPQTPFLFRPPEFGYNIAIVYGIWLTVVILLYPICRWYNRYKSNHHQWWLSYL